ncbi:MAG TPA: hypothetical protein VG900_11845 [Hyphomicrobiaceae bacterium]|jgi:hypothetical protein|nr:hypothetical protein [Hyphomicrobiaceae bacterium]
MSGIEAFLGGFSGDIVDWAIVLAVLAGLSLLVMRIELPRRAPRVPRTAYAPSPVENEQPHAPSAAAPAWQRLTRVAEPSSDPLASAIETRRGAGQHIDAAEHAFNRLLADCESVMSVPVKPTLKPVSELPPKPAEPKPDDRSIAA